MFWEIVKGAMFVGSVIYQYATAPKSKDKKKMRPDYESIDFPRSEEGSGISAVFGYAYIDNPIVPWWKLETPTVIPFPLQSNYAFYFYFVTFQEIICLSGIDSIEFIFINNSPNRCDWNGNAASPDYYGWSSNSTVTVGKSYRQIGTNQFDYDNPTEQIGTVYLEFGGAAQTPNSFLETADEQGTTISAYRGVVQAIWPYRLINHGINQTQINTPDPCQYLVKRLLTQHDGTAQWYDSKCHTGYGLNAIHIIREAIISEVIGAGLDSSLIDSTTFEDAADTCYTEGVGLSFHISDTDMTVREFIKEVLEYVRGVIYFDMADLKFKAKLFRNDYVYAALDEITVSDVYTISNINEKADSAEVINDCTVVYRDRYTFKEKSAKYSDLASIQQIGLNSQTINLKWTMNPELALKIATETVLFSIAQLHSLSLTGPLTLDQYYPGDVFKLTYARRGWNGIVVRVLEKKRTGINGEEIELSLIEDYFGIGQGAFGDGTTTPVYVALDDVDEPYVTEAPYFLNKQIYDDPDTVLTEDYNHILAVCGNPNNYLSFGSYWKISTDSDYAQFGSGNTFITIAELDDDVGYTDTFIRIVTLPSGLKLFIIINGEIMKVVSSSSSPAGLTVNRGMHDTLPQEHSAADKVYIFSSLTEPYEVITEELELDSTYNIKLTSEAFNGSQSPAEATANNVTINNRSILPYNGAGLKANAFTFDNDGVIWIGTLDGTLLTWYLRNRLLQYNQWLTQTNENLTPEATSVFRISIYDSSGATLKRQVITDANPTSVTVTNTAATSLIDPDTGTIYWYGDITSYFSTGDTVTTANCDNAGNNTTFVISNIFKYGPYTKIYPDDMSGMTLEYLDGLDETISKSSSYVGEYDYTDTLETADFGSLQDDKIVKLTGLRQKITSPYVFTNDDATSSITASTGTIIFVGQDLTTKIQVGYSFTTANCTNAGNNNTFTVATISESGGDTTITVTDNTGMVDETLTGLDETISVPDYWESWQDWDLHVMRLTAPTVAFSEGLVYDNIDPTTDYEMIYDNGDGFYYEYEYATAPAEPSVPSDPTTASTFSFTNLILEAKINNYRYKVKIMAKKNGQLSPIGSGQNYT